MPSPPTEVTAVQVGPTSIRVTWTPPLYLRGWITGYTISYSYSGGGSSSEPVVGGVTNSRTLTGLTNGKTYTISIVATSMDRDSESVASNRVPLSK